MTFQPQKDNVVAKKQSANAAINAAQIDTDQPSLTVGGPPQASTFSLAFGSADNSGNEITATNAVNALNTALAQLRVVGGTYTLSTGTNPATGAPTAVVTFTN